MTTISKRASDYWTLFGQRGANNQHYVCIIIHDCMGMRWTLVRIIAILTSMYSKTNL